MGFEWTTNIDNKPITKDEIRDIYRKINLLNGSLLISNIVMPVNTKIGVTIDEYNKIVRAVDNLLDNNYCRMHNNTDYIEYKTTYNSGHNDADNSTHLVSDKTIHFLTNHTNHNANNCPQNKNAVNTLYTPAAYASEAKTCITHYTIDRASHKVTDNSSYYLNNKISENYYVYSNDNTSNKEYHNIGVQTSHYIVNNGSDYKGDNSSNNSTVNSSANSNVKSGHDFTLISR